jgi:cell division protein FtsN
MEIFNQDFIQEIIRLTWRNPAFMAIAIALVWLIPQLFIRKIMEKKYELRKIEIQKNKIQKLYPTNTPK